MSTLIKAKAAEICNKNPPKRGMGSRASSHRLRGKKVNHSYHLLSPYYGPGTAHMRTYFAINFLK